MIKWHSAAAVALLPFAVSGAAQAAQATGTLPVTATVLNVCVVTPVALNFGNVSWTANTDITTTIAVTCTIGTGYTVALDQGSNGSAVTARKMKATLTTDTINYSLYRDTSRTLNWGTTAGTDTVAGTGSGLVQTLTVYGRVPSAQVAPADVYTDTVNVTVNY